MNRCSRSASIQKSIFDWVKEKSPAIAIIAGNLLLLAGEYRVYHFAYESSGEAWKGWFAVLATFFPFVLWEILVQHSKANGVMRALAWAGIVISLGLGVVIGVADFVTVNGQTANAEPLLAALAVSLSLHAVFFLAYFYSHPDIKSHRLVAQALARQQLAEASAEVAESILKSARNRLELERRIAADYGYENLRRAIAEIEGRPYHAPKQSSPRASNPQTWLPPCVSRTNLPRPSAATGINRLAMSRIFPRPAGTHPAVEYRRYPGAPGQWHIPPTARPRSGPLAAPGPGRLQPAGQCTRSKYEHPGPTCGPGDHPGCHLCAG
jgi:hypothetical protein